MTALLKMLLLGEQLTNNTLRVPFTPYNWRYYKEWCNTDITPTSGVRLFFKGELLTELMTPDCTYTSRIRTGSKLYTWVCKHRSFTKPWGKYYIIPQSW